MSGRKKRNSEEEEEDPKQKGVSSPDKGKGYRLGKAKSTENGISHFFRRKTQVETHSNRDELLMAREEKKRARHRNRSEKFQTNIRPEVEDDSTQSGHFCTVSCEEVAESLPSRGVLIKGLADLPPDVQESLKRMKIEESVLEEHLETLLNILSFADKHIPRRR